MEEVHKKIHSSILLLQNIWKRLSKIKITWTQRQIQVIQMAIEFVFTVEYTINFWDLNAYQEHSKIAPTLISLVTLYTRTDIRASYLKEFSFHILDESHVRILFTVVLNDDLLATTRTSAIPTNKCYLSSNSLHPTSDSLSNFLVTCLTTTYCLYIWPNRPCTPQSHKSHQPTPHKFQTLKQSTTPDWQNPKHSQDSPLKEFQALLLQEFNQDSQDS